MGAAAEAVTTRPRRRPLTWRRTRRGTVPYLLILPVIAVLAALLGYPLYQLVRLSFQQYGLPELIAHKGVYVGFANYTSVLHDGVFWHTLLRTVVFTAACVSLTIVLGTLMALLLVRVSGWVRILITVGLILVWAMPPVVSVQVWGWMTDVQNGVLNDILTRIHFGNYFEHNWFASPFSQLAMVTSIVVWGALPFVAITTYAALSQVPHELMEAAQIDGARSWQVFKDVTYPVIQPVLLILACLSILWDFGVFTQAYLLIGQPHILPSNYLMSIYLWEEAYFKNDYGRGAAISILMLGSVAILSLIYVRRMLSIGEVRPVNVRLPRKLGWNIVGIAVFVVMAFPVFWMVSTAFKTNDQINSGTSWIPLHPTLANFTNAIHKPYFWSDLKNTVIVVLVGVGIAMVLSFLAAVALAKYRFHGRRIFVLLIIGVQMIPGIGLIIPLYVMLADVPVLGINLVGKLTGVIIIYISSVLAFSVWTLRGFLLGIPKELEEAAMVDGSTRLGAFIRILLPLVAPGLVATSVFAFITCWNEYIFANLLLQRQGSQTITVWLASYTGGETYIDWGGLMAASTLIAVPVVVFFLIVQRKIAFGLTTGAVKA